ncbi:hypothetical protein V1511DRAFT_460645 [Dipodascopsis uninucleata]
MSRHPITCHVLDTVAGKPAVGIICTLKVQDAATREFIKIAQASTNSDGRVVYWNNISQSSDDEFYKILNSVGGEEAAKTDRLLQIRFDGISEYFDGDTFFPYVDICFIVKANALPSEHFHVPLLLSRYSYSTYRGS